jgi:hypothetical protein
MDRIGSGVSRVGRIWIFRRESAWPILHRRRLALGYDAFSGPRLDCSRGRILDASCGILPRTERSGFRPTRDRGVSSGLDFHTDLGRLCGRAFGIRIFAASPSLENHLAVFCGSLSSKCSRVPTDDLFTAQYPLMKVEHASRGNPYPAALPMLMFASLTHGACLRSGIPHWGRSLVATLQ